MTDLIVLGDWGTSRRRLYLCDATGTKPRILDQKEGAGVSIQSDCENAFSDDIADWRSKYSVDRVTLCGMVGSNIGWRNVDYVPCPADASDIANGAVSFDFSGCHICILPGITCENDLGLRDIMRGEETQLIGLLAMQDDRSTYQVVCLPGTHTKWARVDEQGRILAFTTSFQGELYDMLCRYSTLISSQEAEFDWSAFTDAVRLVQQSTAPDILYSLFSTRSEQILGGLPPQSASSYLSGLMIGHEFRGAVTVFGDQLYASETLPIIGSDLLCQLYSYVAEQFGIAPCPYSSKQVTIEGLVQSAH